jgi:acyl-CoA synthetase (AMP-forming)/AMP-acid ligase II
VDLHFATAWEVAADTVPERDAIVQGQRRVKYRDFDDVGARFASALEAAGVAEGASVGLYLYNCPEYLLAQHGAFKHRAVPVNVNYRYLDDELAYLLDNSDAAALVFHSSLGDRVASIRDSLPKLRLLVEVDDGAEHLEGSVNFDELVRAHAPQPRKVRSRDDLYMLYTGGTTGMPKGVMYHHAQLAQRLYSAFAVLGLKSPVPTLAEEVGPLVAEINSVAPVVSVTCCPLMHGTGMWVSAMRALLCGGTAELLEHRTFDPHELWTLVERERVTEIVIVGDAFARPMLRALEEREREGRPYDTSSVQVIASSGAIWSAEIKDGLRARLSAQLVDALGSTEAGSFGVSTAGNDARVETARFSPIPGTKVITDDGRDVVAGSSESGMLASRTPAFGYFKDKVKSQTTFIQIDGQSYVLTGDWATVEADGTIALLGRGSICINSGGEKVFAEEVEEAIKRHEGIDDCLVVGLPDERFGQRVVAVAASSCAAPPSGEEIREWLRSSLAHYKIPKTITVLDSIRRAPNGKADYKWAKETVLANSKDQ